MADNFAGFIVHRQCAPESRDWLAKLMGTTALWQSTDQTSGHAATGAGSRRRVREFRVSSDTFSELRVGEAIIHTTLGPPPRSCQIQPVQLRRGNSPRRISVDERSACEIRVHPTVQLPVAARPEEGATVAAQTPVPSSGQPRRPDRREDPTADDAHRGVTTPDERQRRAQTFDDA